ncbi:hypothetical protein AeMF1_004278, partial [Aphanomyces euteiches]
MHKPLLHGKKTDYSSISNHHGYVNAPLTRLVDRGGTFEPHGKQPRATRGLYNVTRVGGNWRKIYWDDLFHTIVNTSTSRILYGIFVMYTAVVFIFAVCYYAVSRHDERCNVGITTIMEAYIFSVETIMTIGYGAPTNDIFYGGCSSMALLLTVESIGGIFLNSICVGMFFVRFARATKRANSIIFSEVAVVREIRGEFYLMFQVCERRHHQLVEAHVRCYAVRNDMSADGESELLFQPHPMRLQQPDDELGGVLLMALPQMVVHRIDPWSPLFPPQCLPFVHEASTTPGFPEPPQRAVDHDNGNRDYNQASDVEQPTQDQIEQHLLLSELEIVVILEGTDAMTGNTMQARYSYTPHDLRWRHAFERCVSRDPVTQGPLIDFDKFHQVVPEVWLSTFDAVLNLPRTSIAMLCTFGFLAVMAAAAVADNDTITIPLTLEAPSTLFNLSMAQKGFAPPRNLDASVGDIPIPTNPWWGNLISTGKDAKEVLRVWTNPYAIAPLVTGLQISYPAATRAFGGSSGNAKANRYYLHASINDLTLSAAESARADATSFRVMKWDDLGVNIRKDAVAGKGSIEAYLVSGMAFVTAKYTQLSPILSTEHAITAVNDKKLSEGQTISGTKFTIALNNAQTWVVYTSSSITFLHHNSQLVASAPFTGTVQVAMAKVAADVAVYDKYKDCIVQGGKVTTATTDYTFAWTTQGACSNGLLHFALTHHSDSIDGATATAVQGLSPLYSTTRGRMLPFATKSTPPMWKLLEPTLANPGFYPRQKPTADRVSKTNL